MHDVLVCVTRVLERRGARRAHHGPAVLVHILPRAADPRLPHPTRQTFSFLVLHSLPAASIGYSDNVPIFVWLCSSVVIDADIVLIM